MTEPHFDSGTVCLVQLKGKKSPFAAGLDEQQQQYIRSRLSKRGSSGDLPKRGSSDTASWQSAPSRQGSGVSFPLIIVQNLLLQMSPPHHVQSQELQELRPVL